MQKRKALNIFLASIAAFGVLTLFHRKKNKEAEKTPNDMVALPFPETDNNSMLKMLEKASENGQAKDQTKQTEQNQVQDTTTLHNEDTQPKKILVSMQPQQPVKTCLTQQEREDALVAAYFPLLKLNEGERLYFYRCSAKKVTVGYGSNVEQNPSLLDNVTIYHNKLPLTAEQRADFMSKYTSMKKSELRQYTITKTDAEKMAVGQMRYGIQTLRRLMLHSKTNQPYFNGLPIPMQALSLDIFYNVGEAGFKKFRRYQAALEKNDFAGAVKECTVYTNKEKKTVNQFREARKKRLYVLTLMVQRFTPLQYDQLYQMVYYDYKRANPKVSFHNPEADAEYAMIGHALYVEKWRLIEQAHKQKTNEITNNPKVTQLAAGANKGNG